MTHPTDDSLKPCPFCGSQPEPAPYVLKCVNAYCEAQPSVSGGNDDECATAWNKRALLAEQARPTKRKTYKPGNGGACSICGQPEGDHYKHGNDCPDMRGVEQST